ncbi:DEAD/DEAH box helicase [Myxococcota bacterium]|nr:DEAD/DEAH box helicase [Myxococcota bacterium]
MDVLAPFHPAVRTWFERRFVQGPTDPQERGWPSIREGRDCLIAAPTGSGKTLAAFLVCIDRLYRECEAGLEAEEMTDVVYVSPLKALAVDIQHNLEQPLAEISAIAAELGMRAPSLRTLVRSGDTPASARTAMLRHPPHLLVTTPESLYLLLTAERSRALLRRVRTVIVDEVHAVARDKRGSHLALSLERLDSLCEQRPQRVGLSATQRPLATVARWLVGAGRDCVQIDVGHRRTLDLAVEVPESDLEAVASREQWAEIVEKVAVLVGEHRTTLVFCNTRRLAERFAHLLEERLGLGHVAAHHGSLSKDRRLRIEDRLRAGDLDVLVATASLELGIDIGPVDLVCQLGSPGSLATFLQRVGRSGHARGAIPRGRLFPTTRDELVECAALVRGVLRGNLDRVRPPQAPLDILAQQIVAACAAEDWSVEALWECYRRASPFSELKREDFDAVIEMLADGIQTGRGRRAAYLHYDRVHGVVRGRRGARIAALTSGGAIPETADYRVVADPDDAFVGTVNEDWAIESMAGDVFLLGSTSWRIRRVEPGVVRVSDAAGAPPTIPFWLGEAPARTAELSAEVAQLRDDIEDRIRRGEDAAARTLLQEEAALDSAGAEQLVTYLAAVRGALGVLPTQRDLVVERFFDESGGMQLVVHAPFGARVTRALGLAVRKRICRTFDFELQAAANDDGFVLSLGPQHSFSLESFVSMLSSRALPEVLSQAVLDSPMFTARWRWNLSRALVVLRFKGGRRNPPPIQRMESDDLMAAVFPGLAACQENQAGPIEIPDQVIVRQTLHDCLHEAMDVEALGDLLRGIEAGEVRVHLCETTEPSWASHELLNGKPYTFLDDAPLEERRSRAVTMRRGLPVAARDLARLDLDAIDRVREEARPAPRDLEELHDVLQGLGVSRAWPGWEEGLQQLLAAGRATRVATSGGSLWLVAESMPLVAALFPDARFEPELTLPSILTARPVPTADAAATAVIRGWLHVMGPCLVEDLSRSTALAPSDVEAAVAALELEGFALRGSFDTRLDGEEQWCARHLLTRIHTRTQVRLRREIEPVTCQDFLRFLFRWQHVAPHTQREGRRGTLAAVEQLQGFEIAAGAWEDRVLSARVVGYRADWLDALCLSGDVVWGRTGIPTTGATADPEPGRGGAIPSRSTPLCVSLREDLPWLLAAARGDGDPVRPGPGPALDLLEQLEARGALFSSELAAASHRLPVEIEQGLWDLVARGLVTADGFTPLRSLLGAGMRWSRARDNRSRRRLRRGARGRTGDEGRWALLPLPQRDWDREDLAEAVAEQLLARWGVVFRDLLARESLAIPWRDIVWAFRRMEARGVVRGGRFVTGFSGEQYALPGAVEALRRVRRQPREGERVEVSALDPLNLVGILTPGPRVPAVGKRRVVYLDGLPQPAETDLGTADTRLRARPGA